MIEPISAYKIGDGRIFQTRSEAEQEEFYILLRQEWGSRPPSLRKLAQSMDKLQSMLNLSKRDRPPNRIGTASEAQEQRPQLVA